MIEITIVVNREFLERLKKRLGEGNSVAITRLAFSLLAWAVEEKESKRLILSSDSNSGEVHRLVMPELEAIRA